MGVFQKLLSQTAIYGLSTVVGRLLNYLLVPLYLRVLAPVEYGVVADFYAFAAFGAIIFLYGMETAYFRFSKENGKSAYHTAFASVFWTSIIIAGLLILFKSPIAAATQYSGNEQYVVWFATILMLDALTAIPFARLRNENKAFTFASIKLLNIALNIGFNLFFLVYCKQNLSSLPDWFISWYSSFDAPAFIFLANLIANASSALLLLPRFKIERIFPDWKLWRSMLLYALPLVLVGLSGMVNEVLDRILLKELLPMGIEEARAQVGIYGAVYKIATLMALLTQAFRMAAEPFFFEQGKEKAAGIVFAKLMEYFVGVAALFYVWVNVFLYYPHKCCDQFTLARWIIGTEHEEYYSGLDVVPILFMANILFGIYYNLSAWYKLSDKTIYGAMISLGGALVTIIGNIITIPTYGFRGSAWTTLICFLLMVAASYLMSRKHFPIPYKLSKILMLLLLAIGFVWIQDQILTNAFITRIWMVLSIKLFFCLTFTMIIINSLKLNKILNLSFLSKKT